MEVLNEGTGTPLYPGGKEQGHTTEEEGVGAAAHTVGVGAHNTKQKKTEYYPCFRRM